MSNERQRIVSGFRFPAARLAIFCRSGHSVGGAGRLQAQ
jgi:hypothetical protein